jgi:RecB family endonuclease NucS
LDDKEPQVPSSEFAYESHLRDYLANNLEKIEPGMRLYTDEEDENIKGVEFEAGGRRIDILAIDKESRFVAIELKVSRGYERSVGQLLRYEAWVRQNLADGQKVRGIVIAKEISEDLKLAASETKDIDLFVYDLKIDLRKINSAE